MLDAQARCVDDFSFVTKRNCSIAPMPLCVWFAAVGAFALLIAAGWSLQGAWLILPFAGIEVLALIAAFAWQARSAGDFERISVRERRLVIEVREMGRMTRHEFNTEWAQLVPPQGRAGALAVRYRGTELRIGRHLTEPAQQALATELGRWLRPAVR
jgi:uncharacterized membrane protein